MVRSKGPTVKDILAALICLTICLLLISFETTGRIPALARFRRVKNEFVAGTPIDRRVKLETQSATSKIKSVHTSKNVIGANAVSHVPPARPFPAAMTEAHLPSSITKSTASADLPDLNVAPKATIKVALDDMSPLVVSPEVRALESGCGRSGPSVPRQFCKKDKKCEKPPCGGRLFFLFLLLDTLYHLPIWRAFFSKAPPGAWRAFVHCSNPKGCRASALFEVFPTFELIPTVKSARCRDLVSAEAQLFQQALQYLSEHGGVRQKFILVSHSTLPAKPFWTVYNTILAHPDSDFCLHRQDTWLEAVLHYRREGNKYFIERGGDLLTLLPKHSQFVVLNAKDAEVFVDEWSGINPKTHAWDVPLKSKRWTEGVAAAPKIPSTSFLWYHDHDRKFLGTCADELAVFATIFGTFEPGEFGGKTCPLNKSSICVHPEALLRQRRCYTFSIRESKNTLLQQLRADPQTTVSLPNAQSGHPAEFHALSSKSIRLLQSSSWLFVRKFSPNASIVGYEEIVT